MTRALLVLFLILINNTIVIYAQVDQEKEVEPSKKSSLEVSKKAKKIVSSLESENEVETAKNYEEVGKTFLDKNEIKKAETYFVKALEIFKKLNLNDDVARVSRNLGKIAEKLEDKKSAINFYQNSIDNNSSGNSLNTLNYIDIQRLDDKSDDKELNSLDKKITILKKDNNIEELKDGYIQLGEANEKRNNFEDAIVNYKKAYDLDKTSTEQKIELNDKISKLFIHNKKFESALDMLNKQLLDAQQTKQFNLAYHIYCKIADIYFSNNENDKALENLKLAFQVALKNGNSKLVKQAVDRLINYYKKHHLNNEQIALYDDFISHFEDLLKSDSSLIDENTFSIIEQKINQLEKEKVLKDKLIHKTTIFNTILIVSLIVLIILIFIVLKSSRSIRRKNKQIELQSLRREMNPHFIFNSLNSVNQFIAQNNELKANRFLTSYSNLMRTIMENSSTDFISLSTELELIEKYVSLEHQRFSDKFEYQISVDEKLDVDALLIPNMIIQPNIENAIWHGLRYLDKQGKLLISFTKQNNNIVITIDDSGIGIAKSKSMKTKNQRSHVSLGLKNIKERINILNDLYHLKIVQLTKEKTENETGTIVEIIVPLTLKSSIHV